MFDVTVAWASKDNTGGDPLLAARAAETHKDTEYRHSVDRCTESLAAERERQGLSPLPSGSHFSERSHFVPLAFCSKSSQQHASCMRGRRMIQRPAASSFQRRQAIYSRL